MTMGFDPLIAPAPAILGHLGFRSFLPHPFLQTWVQCYWVARQAQIPEKGFTENLYPDGGTNINFRFIPDELPDVSFHSFQKLTRMQFNGDINLLGIRFRPGGAFQLLGMDMPALTGGSYALEELDTNIDNSSLNLVREQLQEIKTAGQRIELIDSWLLQQAAKNFSQNGPIQYLLPALPSATNTIDEMSAEVNLSRRQLERRFRQEVGMTLVQIKQLQRMKKARQLISLNPDKSLIDLAHELGFYDQAHFVHQFQKVNQQSPGEYRDRKRTVKNNMLRD